MRVSGHLYGQRLARHGFSLPAPADYRIRQIESKGVVDMIVDIPGLGGVGLREDGVHRVPVFDMESTGDASSRRKLSLVST